MIFTSQGLPRDPAPVPRADGGRSGDSRQLPGDDLAIGDRQKKTTILDSKLQCCNFGDFCVLQNRHSLYDNPKCNDACSRGESCVLLLTATVAVSQMVRKVVDQHLFTSSEDILRTRLSFFGQFL